MKHYFTALAVDGERQCTLCLKQKPEELFSRQRSKFKNTGICKDCKKIKDKAYYYKHREKRLAYWDIHREKYPNRLREINRKAVAKFRFGTDRTSIIKNDSECEHCGMGQEEHLSIFNSSLNIHHKDGMGRKAQRLGLKPNNSPDNLQILCVRCHTIEENRYHKNYAV